MGCPVLSINIPNLMTSLFMEMINVKHKKIQFNSNFRHTSTVYADQPRRHARARPSISACTRTRADVYTRTRTRHYSRTHPHLSCSPTVFHTPAPWQCELGSMRNLLLIATREYTDITEAMQSTQHQSPWDITLPTQHKCYVKAHTMHKLTLTPLPASH